MGSKYSVQLAYKCTGDMTVNLSMGDLGSRPRKVLDLYMANLCILDDF